jgi:rare lipoprotein A
MAPAVTPPSQPAAAPAAARTGSAAPAAGTRSRAGGELTIQVAAYPARAAADRARKRLTAEGFPARVVPAGRYYRVRVGRYRSRAAAAPVVKKLKKLHNETIIVDAEPGP